jgi:ABC-2 type transport system permease protein
MSTVANTLTDSATMLRRNLKHQRRYPSLTLMLAGFPIVFLLLFVYVFGGQLGTGLGVPGATHGGRSAYLTYVVPGILIMTVASAALGTAISIASDMTQGIIDRFRTMAIARAAVLTGHVIGSLLQTLAVLVLVILVSIAIGFRPTADPLSGWRPSVYWDCSGFALIWLSTALGLAAKSVRNGQQHADVPHPTAVPQQRFSS